MLARDDHRPVAVFSAVFIGSVNAFLGVYHLNKTELLPSLAIVLLA